MNSQDAQKQNDTTSATQDRRPYQKPQLTELGNVRELTRALGGPSPEGRRSQS